MRCLLLALCAACFVAGCAGEETPTPEPSSNESAATQDSAASDQSPEPGDRRITHRTADGTRGRWSKRASGVTLTAQQQEQIEKLNAVGYVDGSAPARPQMGVTVFERDRAQPGLNFYCSGHGPEALLVDMDGRVLHRWQRSFREIWPDDPALERKGQTQFWRRVHLYDNGDILVIFEGLGIVKLDKDSNLLWANRNNAHHDLEVLEGGDILVLTRVARVVARLDPERPILEDFVSRLGPDGRATYHLSILECLENSEFRAALDNRTLRHGDILHTNTLMSIRGDKPIDAVWYKQGNLLISIRRLDVVAVIDPEQKSIVASWKGVWGGQHDPRILDNGSMMLFDNYGQPEKSRVIEMDAVTGDLVWYYEGTEARPFFTYSCGTADRLANGNTLIVESDNGRAFEVTSRGEIVWEFHNPQRAGEDEEYVATLFDVIRVDPSRLEFLD